jgi:hypothetical protein
MATTWRVRREGVRELEQLIERGMEACAEVVADRVRANLRPYRDTGAAEDSIHLNTEHLDEWPDPVVFVSGASGDTYFIDQGTSDTPARLVFEQALDATTRDFPRLIRMSTRAGMARSVDILNREFSADQSIRSE